MREGEKRVSREWQRAVRQPSADRYQDTRWSYSNEGSGWARGSPAHGSARSDGAHGRRSIRSAAPPPGRLGTAPASSPRPGECGRPTAQTKDLAHRIHQQVGVSGVMRVGLHHRRVAAPAQHGRGLRTQRLMRRADDGVVDQLQGLRLKPLEVFPQRARGIGAALVHSETC